MTALDFSAIPVEMWDITKLVPYEKNHKKHPEPHVKALANSIAEYGVEHPIAIEEDGTIISGHGRRLALLSLGKTEAPVRVFRGISKDQAAKLRVAANKTTSTDYDTDVLQKELAAILESGLTLDGVGLSDKEMTVLLEDIGEIDLDSMTHDMVGAVDGYEAGIKETAAKAEEAPVPVAKVFGIKNMTPEASRIVTRFIGVAEKATGKKDFEAVLAQMEAVTRDAA